MPVRQSRSSGTPRRIHRRRRSRGTIAVPALVVMAALGSLGAVVTAVDLRLAPAPAEAADGAAGQVLARGTAPDLGSVPGQPITGMARTATGKGYWLAGANGGVFAFGDARFLGSVGSAGLRQPVVDIAGSPGGQGYVLVGRDGGVFAFGDTPFAGSVGGARLNAPVVGVALSPTGNGYWLASRDGGVFAFGDAEYLGSAGSAPLNAPIVAIDATPSGKGYRLLARDGGVFAFGDAPFAGSPAGQPGQPFVDLAGTSDGLGYWVAGAEGAVLPFGSASPTAAVAGTLTASATAALGTPGAPVSAVQATPAGDGVWLATGGVPLGEFGVTCYALRGITASGARVSEDVVAVDPRAIPMGSEIYVGGLGTRRALDTGGAIKGRRLDIWNPSTAYCREFGIQRRMAYTIT